MLSIDRSAYTLLRRRNKRRLIIDIDSTEDPVHGKQEGAAFNGYFEQVCYPPLFCFTGNGELLGAKLRPGNVHSADGVLSLISPLVDRYRSWFKQFWLHLAIQELFWMESDPEMQSSARWGSS